MKKLRFLELLYGGLEPYFEGKYQEAYDFLTINEKRVDGSLAGIYYYRFLFACELKNKELALKILKEAVDDFDFWFPYHSLIQNEIIQIFNEDETYVRLIELCKIREIERKYSGLPKIEVFEPEAEFLDFSNCLFCLSAYF